MIWVHFSDCGLILDSFKIGHVCNIYMSIYVKEITLIPARSSIYVVEHCTTMLRTQVCTAAWLVRSDHHEGTRW